MIEEKIGLQEGEYESLMEKAGVNEDEKKSKVPRVGKKTLKERKPKSVKLVVREPLPVISKTPREESSSSEDDDDEMDDGKVDGVSDYSMRSPASHASGSIELDSVLGPIMEDALGGKDKEVKRLKGEIAELEAKLELMEDNLRLARHERDHLWDRNVGKCQDYLKEREDN